TAEGASKLRQHILQYSKIIEMIDFGNIHLFSNAPGQHNMIFTLERCNNTQAREANRPRLVNVKREFAGETFPERLTTLLDHIQKHIDIQPHQIFEDEYIHIFESPLTQRAMSAKPWTIRYSDSSAVIIEQIEQAGVPLAQVLHINTGIHSNAD